MKAKNNSSLIPKTGCEMDLEKQNIYRIMLDSPADSRIRLARVIEGGHRGERLLLIDGCIGSDIDEGRFLAERRDRLDSGLIELDGEMVYVTELATAPRLIIAGGGHVAKALIRLASITDFAVTVIEDREEFAELLRASGAAEVITDDYRAALEGIAEGSQNYYVCVTRGHRFDMECLRVLLNKPCAYLGMMGSKRRAASVREELLSEGYDEAKVLGIHSPVGLDIKAETPEEIAVSILAELIAVRNSALQRGSLDRRQLEVLAASGESGAALATIISKTGSAPRSVGTSMVVKGDGSITGTIGGGPAEAEIRASCLKLLQQGTVKLNIMDLVMTKDEAEEEGMVCGGSIKVLIELV